MFQAKHEEFCPRTCSWSTTNLLSAAAALSATSTAAEVACALLAAAAAFCSSSTRLCRPASLFRSAALAAAGKAVLSMLCANTLSAPSLWGEHYDIQFPQSSHAHMTIFAAEQTCHVKMTDRMSGCEQGYGGDLASDLAEPSNLGVQL